MPLSSQQQSSLQLGSLVNALRTKDPVLANALASVQQFSNVTDQRIRNLADALQGILGSGNEFTANFRRVSWHLPNMNLTVALPGVITAGAQVGAIVYIDWPATQQQIAISPEGIYCSTGPLLGNGLRTVNVGSFLTPLGLGTILSSFDAAGNPVAQLFNGVFSCVSALIGAAGPPTVSGTGVFQTTGDTVRLFGANRTPANSAAPGFDGELCADNSFLYGHTGGSWRRAAWVTF